MGRKDWLLSGARWLLRAMQGLNLAVAIAFALGLVAFGSMIEARLVAKYGPSLDAQQAMAAIRILLAMGIAAAVGGWIIAARLLAMIATVEHGDPFTAANAARLAVIGWVLVSWQLLDLLLGAMLAWLTALRVEHATWSPSAAGWILVLMTFILARIFAHGAAMRDELEGTI